FGNTRPGKAALTYQKFVVFPFHRFWIAHVENSGVYVSLSKGRCFHNALSSCVSKSGVRLEISVSELFFHLSVKKKANSIGSAGKSLTAYSLSFDFVYKRSYGSHSPSSFFNIVWKIYSPSCSLVNNASIPPKVSRTRSVS